MFSSAGNGSGEKATPSDSASARPSSTSMPAPSAWKGGMSL